MTAAIAVPSCKLLNILLVNGMVVDTPIKQNIFNKQWLRAKLSFPFSTQIVGNSKAGLAAYGASKKKSVCIYNGIDLNRFKNLADPEVSFKQIFGECRNNDFVIGMVAAFEPRKDYRTLIKAALSLIEVHESMRVILVGSGSDFTEIKNSVPQVYRNKIVFLGKRDDIESIVSLFDVGILLTNSVVHGEGISNSIIEYMALGKPVIATSGGGTNEIVIDNGNGFLIGPGETNQLIENIEKLISDGELRLSLGENAKKTVYKQFDLKLMTRDYILMYQQLLQP